jgi:hypothetical protein
LPQASGATIIERDFLRVDFGLVLNPIFLGVSAVLVLAFVWLAGWQPAAGALALSMGRRCGLVSALTPPPPTQRVYRAPRCTKPRY